MGDIQTIAIITAVFLLAGGVKGVIGMGLPTVSLALLTVLLGLKDAIALMLIPSMVTNVWQGVVGGHFTSMVRKFWPLLLAAVPTIWIGVGVLSGADAQVMAAVLGALLAAYSLLALLKITVQVGRRHEKWMSPLVGAMTGMVTGLTGSFIMPSVLYMQAVNLTRHELVQAMGISFAWSNLVLALALAGHSLLPLNLGAASALALTPAIAGMVLGSWVRENMSEERFRQVFFLALLALGAWLMAKPFVF